jgi:chromosome segregation ATPase
MDNYSDLMTVAETANAMSQNLDFDLKLISDSGATKEQVAAVTALIQFAAKPGNVLDLLAEIKRLRTAEGDAMTYKAGMENVAQQRDELKTELEKVKADRKACWEEFKVQGRQVDQLKAEVDSLTREADRQYTTIEAYRKNAERFQWLLKNSSVILDNKAAYQAETGFIKFDTMPGRGEVESAIDAAMTK